MPSDGNKIVRLHGAEIDRSAIELEKKFLRQRLGALVRLSSKRGRPPTEDAMYEALLDAWEIDALARPGIPVKTRVSDFLRKNIPAKLGLKIGASRSRGGTSQGAMFDALARGRWVRASRICNLIERRTLISLMDKAGTARATQSMVKLFPKIPAKLRKR